MKAPIKITRTVFLDAYYARDCGCWVGRYVTLEGITIGDCWFAPTRDYVLINRPATPRRKS